MGDEMIGVYASRRLAFSFDIATDAMPNIKKRRAIIIGDER